MRYEYNAPTLLTIRQTVDRIKSMNRESKITYTTVRDLCDRGMIVYITHGNRIYINFEKFLEYLNTNTSGNPSPVTRTYTKPRP